MSWQTLLDFVQLLDLRLQPRNQVELGVPQRHDATVHLGLLFSNLSG